MRTAQKPSITAVPDWLAKLAGTPDDRIAIKTLAAACGVHDMTVRNWAKAGKLETTKLGARVFITRQSVERLLKSEPASGGQG